MDKRLDASRAAYHEQNITANSKKSKKRSSKRNSVLGPWLNNVPNEQNNDMVPEMEYQHILWQQQQQQQQHNFSSNGQRLFTATSDPSVCGYTPMPMTYTMEPVSLPTMYRVYQPVPLSGIRPVHNRARRHCQNHPVTVGHNSVPNGYNSLQENGSNSPIHNAYQNGDYASLPANTVVKNNSINGDELNSEHRRYSDPGLGSAEPPTHSPSEDSDSIESGSSITTIGRSNKLVLSLIEQMTDLKKSNSQLFKELNEAKSELESIKAKLAQYKHSPSSEYQPGMLSDLIREIREANKSCEEALVIKIKSMVEEKLSQRSSEIEKLNNQMSTLAKEKEKSDSRVAKLEEEVATLKLNANNEGREIAAFEEETLALRRELQEARASRTLAENHAAKLEKLVEILRRKMNGAADEETVAKIRDLLAFGLAPGRAKRTAAGASSSPSASCSDTEDEDEENEEGEEEQVDEGMKPGKEKIRGADVHRLESLPGDLNSSIVLENGINLSGPVTDL